MMKFVLVMMDLQDWIAVFQLTKTPDANPLITAPATANAKKKVPNTFVSAMTDLKDAIAVKLTTNAQTLAVVTEFALKEIVVVILDLKVMIAVKHFLLVVVVYLEFVLKVLTKRHLFVNVLLVLLEDIVLNTITQEIPADIKDFVVGTDYVHQETATINLVCVMADLVDQHVITLRFTVVQIHVVHMVPVVL
jgi:hypothetical protein